MSWKVCDPVICGGSLEHLNQKVLDRSADPRLWPKERSTTFVLALDSRGLAGMLCVVS